MLSVRYSHHQGELYTTSQPYKCLVLYMISFTDHNNPFPAITKPETGNSMTNRTTLLTLLRAQRRELLASTPDPDQTLVEPQTTVIKRTRCQLSRPRHGLKTAFKWQIFLSLSPHLLGVLLEARTCLWIKINNHNHHLLSVFWPSKHQNTSFDWDHDTLTYFKWNAVKPNYTPPP